MFVCLMLKDCTFCKYVGAPHFKHQTILCPRCFIVIIIFIKKYFYTKHEFFYTFSWFRIILRLTALRSSNFSNAISKPPLDGMNTTCWDTVWTSGTLHAGIPIRLQESYLLGHRLDSRNPTCWVPFRQKERCMLAHRLGSSNSICWAID